jgi:hypothetical protein
MPRKATPPVVLLYLSASALARSFMIDERHVRRAVALGHLHVRTLPNSNARRISVAEAESWYLNYWLPARPVKSRRKFLEDHPEDSGDGDDENI